MNFKLPEVIEVTQDEEGFRIDIDGEPFKFALADDSVNTTVTKHEFPGITLTLVAKRVVTNNSIKTKEQ